MIQEMKIPFLFYSIIQNRHTYVRTKIDRLDYIYIMNYIFVCDLIWVCRKFIYIAILSSVKYNIEWDVKLRSQNDDEHFMIFQVLSY